MKKILFALVLMQVFTGAKAQLSQTELNQLNPTQKSIYLNQSREIKQKYETAIFRAEDMIKMGKEMKSDDNATRDAGAYYIAKGMELKEAAEKEYRMAQQRLDNAAREGIRNNRMRKD